MHRRAFLAATASSLVSATTVAGAPGPVVLELFTSQGCSSCPPADALLGELARRAGVIALAWHVDYWDSAAWHDPFALPSATARQRAYARALGTTLYTPALVVDGARMVIGSDRSAVSAAMRAAGALPVAVSVADGQARVAAIPGASPRPVTALFVTYDPARATDVRGGENLGRRLRGAHIVRTVQRLALWDGAARALTLPAPATGRGGVVLVQAADLRIVGAASLPA